MRKGGGRERGMGDQIRSESDIKRAILLIYHRNIKILEKMRTKAITSMNNNGEGDLNRCFIHQCKTGKKHG